MSLSTALVTIISGNVCFYSVIHEIFQLKVTGLFLILLIDTMSYGIYIFLIF